MDLALAPEGVSWLGVSRAHLTAQRIVVSATVCGLAVVPIGVLAVMGPSWAPVAGMATALAALAAGWAIAARQWRGWGYAERADDLLVRHGVLVRRLSLIPYGRMQYVDVAAGPLDRRLGIATVVMHTAAAASDARIPGLPTAEAARLRDRLTALGEARAAGL